MTTIYLFKPRKNRTTRFGKYAGLPVDAVHYKSDGMVLVTKIGEWNPFSVYQDELTLLDKPIHGSPKHYTFNQDGSLRTFDHDDSK